MAPAVVIGQAIGRIGCQLSGDGDWGTVTTVPWAMAYPYAVVGWPYPPGVRVHPTPIYESLAYFAIFAILWRWRRSPQPDGTIFCWYLVLASGARFLVEFLRVNPVVMRQPDFRTARQPRARPHRRCAAAGAGTMARSRGLRIALVTVALGVAAVLAVGALHGRTPALAPDFAVPDLAGQAVRLSDLRGKVVLLNLWTTWCPPCREEMPSMERLYQAAARSGLRPARGEPGRGGQGGGGAVRA